MSIVNLGSVKNAPIYNGFYNVIHKWHDEAVNDIVKIDLPFVFSEKKTYFVFLKSKSSTVEIEGNSVSVEAINIITNVPGGYALNGGSVFTPFYGTTLSCGVTLPNKRDNVTGIYIRKPEVTGVVSVLDIGIFEL